jgi:hypothetical protein
MSYGLNIVNEQVITDSTYLKKTIPSAYMELEAGYRMDLSARDDGLKFTTIELITDEVERSGYMSLSMGKNGELYLASTGIPRKSIAGWSDPAVAKKAFRLHYYHTFFNSSKYGLQIKKNNYITYDSGTDDLKLVDIVTIPFRHNGTIQDIVKRITIPNGRRYAVFVPPTMRLNSGFGAYIYPRLCLAFGRIGNTLEFAIRNDAYGTDYMQETGRGGHYNQDFDISFMIFDVTDDKHG